MRYIVLNANKIQQRIEELEEIIPKTAGDQMELVILLDIIQQSTPLQPILEDAVEKGYDIHFEAHSLNNSYQRSLYRQEAKQDYITNFKIESI